MRKTVPTHLTKPLNLKSAFPADGSSNRTHERDPQPQSPPPTF